jgi:hypothetical protein
VLTLIVQGAFAIGRKRSLLVQAGVRINPTGYPSGVTTAGCAIGVFRTVKVLVAFRTHGTRGTSAGSPVGCHATCIVFAVTRFALGVEGALSRIGDENAPIIVFSSADYMIFFPDTNTL